MQTFFPLLGAVLLIASASAYAETISQSGKIDAVTVFSDRAAVTRKLGFDTQAGSQSLRVTGLPAAVDTSSVRVALNGPLTIGGVRTVSVNLAESGDPRVRSLNEQIQTLQDKRQQHVDEKNGAQLQKQFLGGLSGSDDQQGLADPARLERTLELIGKAATSANDIIRKANRQIRELDEQIKALQADLAQLRSRNQRQNQVFVNFDASRAARVSGEITYYLSGASWTPQYRLELNTDSGKLDFQARARIRQSSGEDWSNAKLTLTTARANQGTQMPDLSSWVLNPAPPARPRQDVMMDSLQREAVGAAAAPAPALMKQKPAAFASAAVDRNSFSTDYQLPGRLTVPGDNQPYLFEIDKLSLNATVDLRTTPRLDPQAYLYASFKYPEDSEWLPGPVELYRDGGLAGRAFLPREQAGKSVEFGFGADPKFAVDFKAKPRLTDESGLIKTRLNSQQQFVIKLDNRHAKAYPLRVRDHIPVSGHEDIEVDANWHGNPPTSTSLDDNKGVVEWAFKLGAQKSKTLEYSWTVSRPADMPLPGFP